MTYPLFLSYKGAIIGNGFVAQIDANLKVLARRRDEGTDLIGVVPADVVAGGIDLDEAHARMRDALRERLVAIAKSADTFARFKAEAEQFLQSIDPTEDRQWHEAVARVRLEQDTAGLGLKTVRAETLTHANVTPRKAEDLTPDLNEPTQEPLSGARHVELAA